MDVAFVQNAQHDVHHQDRDDQQHPQVAERTLERLGRALEVRADGRRAASASASSCTFVDHVAQRRARLQVERNRDGRKLSVVIDGLRADVLRARLASVSSGISVPLADLK